MKPNPLIKKTISLNPAAISVEPGGLDDAQWPVALSEIGDVFRCLGENSASLVRSLAKTEPDISDLASITLPPFAIQEGLSFYQAYTAFNRLQAKGISLDLPENSRLYAAFQEGRVPSFPSIIEQLRRGPQQPKKLLTPLRMTRDFFRRGSVSFRPPSLINWQKDTVVTVMTPLISAHAHGAPNRPVFVRRSHWFSPVSKEEERAAIQEIIKTDLPAKATDIIATAFQMGNSRLSDDGRAYFHQLFIQLSALFFVHFKRLQARAENLPNELWTGSGGNTWDRVLRQAVDRNGGMVIGHDHGTGAGHRIDNTKAFGDFRACQQFITFTQAQASGLKRNVWKGMLEQEKLPEIISLEEAVSRKGGNSNAAISRLRASMRSAEPAATAANKRKPTIMYIAYAYDGERTRPFPLPILPIAIDWQARLFSQLKAWGYDVVFKYHPELGFSPQDVENLFGVPALGGRLENHMNEADLIILETPMTSCLVTLALSNKPVVFIDHSLMRWDQEARQMMERRFATVKTSISDTNRLEIDWKALRETIEKAPEKTDRAFAESYFSGLPETRL